MSVGAREVERQTLQQPIDDLLIAINRYLDRDDTAPAADLGQELVRLRHACDLIELGFSLAAAEFANTDQYELDGCVSPMQWIRHNCHMGGGAASRAECVGEVAGSLPESVEAMSRGEIGFAHLGLLASTARCLAESPTATGFDERPLLTKALRHTVGRFRHDCIHARHAADAAAVLAEHFDSVEARRLELTPWGGGGVAISGFFDSVGAATLRTALEPLARRSGTADDRSHERRFADALIELAHHGLDEGVIPGRAGQRPHLQVSTSLDTLLKQVGCLGADLEFSEPITAVTVQRLACDATITRVLLDVNSVVTDVGRAQRVASGPLRRALTVRDRGCAWPGCDRPPSWTAAHHLKHWVHGGSTALGNLVLLCHRHHWMVHEGGWQLTRGDDAVLTAVRPETQRAHPGDFRESRRLPRQERVPAAPTMSPALAWTWAVLANSRE